MVIFSSPSSSHLEFSLTPITFQKRWRLCSYITQPSDAPCKVLTTYVYRHCCNPHKWYLTWPFSITSSLVCFIIASWHRYRLALPMKTEKRGMLSIPFFSQLSVTNLPASFCSSWMLCLVFFLLGGLYQSCASRVAQSEYILAQKAHSLFLNNRFSRALLLLGIPRNYIRAHNTFQKSPKLFVHHCIAFWRPPWDSGLADREDFPNHC